MYSVLMTCMGRLNDCQLVVDYMIWNSLKRLFAPKSRSDQKMGDRSIPDVRWIEAADNQWGIRVLDVRSVTLGTLADARG